MMRAQICVPERDGRLRRRRWAVLSGTLIALTSLAFAASASATYDPVGSGTTKLSFSKEFIGLLRQHGVKLSARAPVKLKGSAVTFPVSGGRLDPVAAKGSVDHEGALIFQAGAHRLPLKSLQLKTTQAPSPLSAKFGGGQLKLAASAKLTTKRQGFGLAAKVSAIKLSAKLATRLDKKLGLRGVFAAGQSLGSSLTDAQPETVAIEQSGKANLELAPEFLAKLASLFVALNPIFPAEHLGTPFTLPIATGKLAPDATAGTLQLAGSLEAIQQGGGQVFLRDPWLDLGAGAASVEFDLEPSPPSPGKLGRVPVFDLGAASVSSSPAARTISVAGAGLSLQAATALAFNEAFAKPQGKADVFKVGEAFATLSFSAQAQ
jgi:hypothetical protein